MSTYIRPLKAKKISHYITIKMPFESKVQAKIIKSCRRRKWKVIKLITTNKHGIGDLLILTPEKRTMFCEVKRPGEVPDPLQDYRKIEFLPFVHAYFFADSIEMFNDKLSTISL